MEKTTKCRVACSANEERVFSPHNQSGVSNFALGERKIRKKMSSVTTNQHSKVLPSVLQCIVIVNLQFAAFALKYI